ncbi:hypothetical protein EAMG_01732 [Escherichia coli M056]|nr:hypothetical protein EAMG_01732 [Escherichia coli M056]
MRLAMEFKDLHPAIREMAASIVRSQLATLDLSTVEKETIDNMVRNVRNAFIGLYGSDNQKIAHPYAHTLGSVDVKNNTLQVAFEHSPQQLKTKKDDADKNNNDESDLFIISSNLLEVMKSELEKHNIKPTPVYLRWVMRIIDASLP